jgi:cell wall-associated NlpC family hydrolase
MLRWICLFCLLVCSSVHALPAPGQDDDTERMLTDKGLIDRLGGQIQHVRQSVGEKASDLVVNAMGFLGVPYKRGGASIETGFDCSGFVRAMYEQTVGLVLPRRANEQAAATEVIDRTDLKPGDLVFFNTMKRAFSHVGIYVGDGKFIHAPRSGQHIRVEDMRAAYWQTRFNGARRVAVAGSDAAGQ